MPHPLVLQLRFARSEFKRGLQDLSDADARKRFMPMNCISWNIGHLASQEQRNWLTRMQGKTPLPNVPQQFGYGQPASTPALAEVRDAWKTITQACDVYLDTLTTAEMQAPFRIEDKPSMYKIGTLLLRQIYHYWYHNGENLAIRQMLGHVDLPEFVGDIDSQAPYEPHS